MDDDQESKQDRLVHAAIVLAASPRALGNALDALGFAEDDPRVVEEEDGRLGFVCCSHDADSDDLFALVAELAARSESWEFRLETDLGDGRAVLHALARHAPPRATVVPLPESAVEEEGAEARAYDLDTQAGVSALRSAIRRLDPANAFVAIRTGADGRAGAVVMQRNPRRTVASATAADEPQLRAAIRQVLPNVMFSVGRPRA